VNHSKPDIPLLFRRGLANDVDHSYFIRRNFKKP